MRYLPLSFLVLLLVFGSTPADAQPVVVENFAATYDYTLNLPGTVVGGGIQFNCSMDFTSIDFAPGSVSFGGQPVDFDGTEASFLASTFNGTVNYPVSAGPAVVDTTWDVTQGGPGATADWAGGHQSLDLGPAFSASSADIDLSSAATYSATTSNWDSSVVPELNGAQVTLAGSQTVLSVDALFGLISVSDNASFTAEAVSVSAVTRWGVALISIGLMGALWLFLRVRRENASPGHV